MTNMVFVTTVVGLPRGTLLLYLLVHCSKFPRWFCDKLKAAFLVAVLLIVVVKALLAVP